MAGPNPAGMLAAMKPTRARWTVLAYLALLSLILYLDRVCLGRAAIPIQKEMGLTESQLGYVHMAFTLAYGLFEIPAGRWGDVHGSRGVLTRIVIWWSAFTALTGAATGLYMLLAIRFLFGAGEAGCYPNTARVLARWFPDRERGMAQGIIITAAQVGGALAPMAADALITAVGWRWTFAVFGALGVLWAAAFYGWFRDDPAKQSSANDLERALIAGGTREPADAGHRAPIPWSLIFRSANVWLLGGVMICAAFASYLYMSWFPKYLYSSRAVPEIDASRLTSLVLAGAGVGCLGGGLVARWIARRFSHPRRAQRLYGFGAFGVAGAALLAIPSFASAPAVAGLACAAALAAHSAMANWWTVATAIGGRHLGALFGLMNSMGVVGAMGAQYFLGAFADWRFELGHRGRPQWDPAMFFYGSVLLVGACLWLKVDSSRSAVEPSPKPPRAPRP